MTSPKKSPKKSPMASPHKSPRRSASTTSPHSPHLSPSLTPLDLSLSVQPLPLPTPLPLPPPSPFPTSSHLSHLLAGPLTQYPPAFSHDLRLLLLPSSSLVRVFALSTSACVLTLSPHQGDVTSVLTHPRNPLQAYTTSLDGHVRLFDLHSGLCIRRFPVSSPILAAVLTPDASRLYLSTNRHARRSRSTYLDSAVARSSRVSSLDLSTGVLTPLYKSRACQALALAPNQRWLASIARHTLTVYDLVTTKRVKYAHTHPLTAVAFHPRDPYLATGDSTGRIHLWHNCVPGDAGKGKGDEPVLTTLHWHAHAVACLSFTGDGVYLLSGGEEAVMVIWQLETGHKQFIPRLLAPLRHIAVSPDNLTYALLHADNAVRLVSAVSSRITRSIQGLQHADGAAGAADTSARPLLIEGAGGVIVSGRVGYLQAYDVWGDRHLGDVDVTERNLISRMDAETMREYRVEGVAVSGVEGGWLMTVERRTDAEMREKQAIKFWRFDPASHATTASAFPASPYALHTRVDQPHKQSVVALAFHPTLPLAVSASSDRTFKVWTLAAKQTLASPAAQAQGQAAGGTDTYWCCTGEGFYRDYPIHCAAFSDAGLLAVSYGQVLTVWGVKEGGEGVRLERTLLHGSPRLPILHVCWVGTGGRVATATAEELCMWDTRTGLCEWSWRVKVSSMACDARTATLAVCIHQQREEQEEKEEEEGEEEKDSEGEGEVGVGKGVEEGRSFFSRQVSHLLLFRPTASTPYRVWRVDDLRLHRWKDSSFVFTSTIAFVQAPAHLQHQSPTLCYLNKRQQLVRLDEVDSDRWTAVGEGEGNDPTQSLTQLMGEETVPLFERLYGKPVERRAADGPQMQRAPVAASAPAAKATGWRQLFDTPAHTLPPMSTLFGPFMDAFLAPKADASDPSLAADSAQPSPGQPMEVDADGGGSMVGGGAGVGLTADDEAAVWEEESRRGVLGPLDPVYKLIAEAMQVGAETEEGGEAGERAAVEDVEEQPEDDGDEEMEAGDEGEKAGRKMNGGHGNGHGKTNGVGGKGEKKGQARKDGGEEEGQVKAKAVARRQTLPAGKGAAVNGGRNGGDNSTGKKATKEKTSAGSSSVKAKKKMKT